MSNFDAAQHRPLTGNDRPVPGAVRVTRMGARERFSGYWSIFDGAAGSARRNIGLEASPGQLAAAV